MPNKPEAMLRIDDLSIPLINLLVVSRMELLPIELGIKPGFETPWFFVVFRVKPV